jgi:DNA-binding transcriptional LysR family regulator
MAPTASLNLNKLRAFEAVARLRSFTAAGEALGLSQPAVTVQVRDLERYFGLPLLDRDRRRRVELTREGEVLYGYARQILAAALEAEQALSGTRQLRSGTLPVVATRTAASYFLPPVLTAFRARYPAVRIRLLVLNTEEALAHLAGLHADLAVVPGDIDDPRLVTVPFCEDRLVLAVSPRHPFARRRTVHARALAGEPMIVRERGSATRALIEAEFGRAGVTVEAAMEFASNEATLEAVAADHGVAVVSEAMARREVEARRVVALEVRGVALRRSFWLAFRRDRAHYPTVRQFIETAGRVLPRGRPTRA